MKPNWTSWPRRFFRWLLAGPFRRLPPAFGNPVPADMQVFQAEAEEAAKHLGRGDAPRPAQPPHGKTRPARPDASLERQ